MLAVAEISGADSIAAALRFAELHPELDRMLPTYVSTGTEYGDFAGIEANVEYLRKELADRHGVELLEIELTADPALWAAVNGRFSSVLAERYGRWLPCVGCHLYLHLMRIPIAQRHGAGVVISGERESHDGRIKANQAAPVLDTYVAVLGSVDLELALPLRAVSSREGVEAILGESWPGGSPQLSCVLSGNERDIDGCATAVAPPELIAEYLLPLGHRIAAVLATGNCSVVWEPIVSDILQGAEAR